MENVELVGASWSRTVQSFEHQPTGRRRSCRTAACI